MAYNNTLAVTCKLMNNSYIIATIIIVVAFLGFTFGSKKTEAPIESATENETTQNINVTSITDGKYKLETESSFIGWKGESVSGSSHEGTINLISGEFEVLEEMISSGLFVIDMNTIKSSDSERLVEHLKSDDFFGVQKFPEATFVLKKMEKISEESSKLGRFVFAGDLTIKGITKPISFTANLNQDPDTGTLMAKASFAINRADWEIKYNSPTFFSDLGDKIIRDSVMLTLDLKAQKVIQ